MAFNDRADRERKPGTGVLLSKDRKHEKAPDYGGELKLDRDYRAGETIKLAGWSKTGARNMPLISISIDNWQKDPNWKPSEEQKRAYEERRAANARPNPGINDDDLPF